jgi:hypothetical protein
MKKHPSRYLFTILFLLIPLMMMGQITTSKSINTRLDALMRQGSAIGPAMYENIDGNAYINEEFSAGKLTQKNGMIFEEIEFNYNIFTDQIEFKNEDKVLAFAQPQQLESVVFDNKKFIYDSFVFKKKSINGYFQLLADGPCKLLVRRSSEIKREKRPPSDFGEVSYRDYFREEILYFITKDNTNLIPVRKNKNSLLKALGDHTEEMEAFLESGNLNLKMDEDLGEVVFYYNQLIKQ